MFHQNTLRYSLYATVVIVILTLTGIFSVFENRDVIEDTLNLSTVVLVLMVGGTAFAVAYPVRENRAAIMANALVATAVTTVTLTALVLIDATIDLRFVFQNLQSLSESTLTAGHAISLDDGEFGGLIEMILFNLAVGIATGLVVMLPARLRETLLLALSITIVISLVEDQINNIITIQDGLVLLVVFGLAYITASRLPENLIQRLGAGAIIGVGIALLVALLGTMGALDDGGILHGGGDDPVILSFVISGRTLGFVIAMAVIGAGGALAANASSGVHDGFSFLLIGLLALGLINWRSDNRDFMLLATGAIFLLLSTAIWFIPRLGQRAGDAFEQRSPTDQRNIQRTAIFAVLLVLLVAPQLMGLYISNVFNLIAMYAIMGIGLNVMIGYAGLLDLGYVASFAIGAYTLGILTTPNIVTCGGVENVPFDQVDVMCTGIMTFWTAWPICVVFSALTGMLLGIPVLRLRGDYLAIVTLGFGEIINRIILSNDFKPLLGGAQGITPIPSPVIDLTGINDSLYSQLSQSSSIYYLFLFGVIITAFVVNQLANSKVGRAWRAVKADENVAAAMGINLVWTKLMAFGISSAFAGLGGAAFGASVQGIFPNSFTLLVSINVLSLIIIGGMGSIPGVVIGAAILIGMPELLRELDAYRLLVFGALLVTVMIVKPEGLLPPQPPRLSEKVTEGTSHA